MKSLEDVAYVLLLALAMPILIALVWIGLIVIIARRTYWWVRGSSTPAGETPWAPADAVGRPPVVVARPLAAASTP
jgi:hypothetical protein